jgi:hypothetical protein
MPAPRLASPLRHANDANVGTSLHVPVCNVSPDHENDGGLSDRQPPPRHISKRALERCCHPKWPRSSSWSSARRAASRSRCVTPRLRNSPRIRSGAEARQEPGCPTAHRAAAPDAELQRRASSRVRELVPGLARDGGWEAGGRAAGGPHAHQRRPAGRGKGGAAVVRRRGLRSRKDPQPPVAPGCGRYDVRRRSTFPRATFRSGLEHGYDHQARGIGPWSSRLRPGCCTNEES